MQKVVKPPQTASGMRKTGIYGRSTIKTSQSKDQLPRRKSQAKSLRTNSANGVQRESDYGRQSKMMQLVPDQATSQMLTNLKNVKFLDLELDKPVRPQETKLGQQFLRKQDRLDKSLQKVIDKTKVAHMQILKKSNEESERQRKAEEIARSSSDPLIRLQAQNRKAAEDEEKMADGFIRSKRSTDLCAKQELLLQTRSMEEAKTNLIQKLNKALIQLDKQNEVKRELNDKLLEQVRFVRDLQIAASKGEDIGSIVSDQMKSDFQREKELSDRLKEELAHCEKERISLLNRIKLLSGEKEIEVQESDGARRTFKVTQINIQRLIDELRLQKATVAETEILVDQSRDVCQVAESGVMESQGHLDALKQELDVLNHDLSIIENKYRDTVYLHEGARDRLGGLHRMHVKLLAARQFADGINKAQKRSKKESLDQMLWVTRGYVNQFGAIYRLRNLILHRNKRIAKNVLGRWFKLACDPMMLLEQNRRMPVFFAKGHQMRTIYNQEYEEWTLSEGLRYHQNSQLDVIKGCIHKFWHRELRLRFQMWKDNIVARKGSLKVIDRALSKMLNFEKARAFTKWSTDVKHQNHIARMHSLVVNTALLQSKQSVFFGWRLWTSACKAEKRALMKRVLRYLRVAVQRKKQLTKMTLSALGFEIQVKHSLQKQCFDALRQNKEEEKFTFVRDKLSLAVQPECESLRNKIDQINAKGASKMRQRATQAFITLFGKQLSQAFYRWKHCAQYKAVELDQNFKIRLLKLFRGKLSTAFNLWRVNRAAAAIEMQCLQYEDIQNQSKEIEEASYVATRQIQEADRSSKDMGAKHLKKLVASAFLKHTKQYFDRWRRRNVHSNNQRSGSELVLRKVRMRYLRMAWNRYRYCMGLMDQDDKNENRVEEVRIRLNYRQKKRIFNAIRGHNHRNLTARKFMKTWVNGQERDNKDIAFRRWKHLNNNETTMQWQSEIQSLKATSEQLHKDDGAKADKLMRAQDKCVRVTNSLEKGCQMTLKKWIHKMLHSGVQRAFRQWKETKANLTGREKLITSIKRQMEKHTLRQAMVRWKNLVNTKNIEMTMEMVMSEETNVGIEESKLQKSVKQHKRTVDKSGRQIVDLDADAERQKKLHENIVTKLTGQNQANFFTSQLNHLFHGWKSYTEKRKRCCEILSYSLRKTALQRTFTRIVQFSRDKHLEGRQEDTAAKVLRSYQKFRLKAALCKWRATEYQNLVVMQMETEQEMSQMKEDFAVHKENIKKHHVAVKSGRKQQRSLADWFTAWQVYSSEERDTRLRTKNLTEIIRAKQGSKALKKWNMRVQKTHQMRAFLKRGHFIKAQITLKSSFRAWKARKCLEKNLGHRLTAALEGIRNVNTQQAFDLIKRYAIEKQSLSGQHRSKALIKVRRCLANYAEFSMRAAFVKWQQWRDRCLTREARIRAAFNNMQVAHLRSAFICWKNKAHQCSVHLQNEQEDGPRNIEAWRLRQDNFNLIKLLKEDGLTAKEIAKIHAQGEQKYRNGVEKSLCRILCKSQDGLNLLPACLDRWKKYTKIRKIWRRNLQDAEIRTLHHDDMAAKLWAFRRLQYTHDDRQKVLWGRPFARLRTQCVQNVEKLDRLADAVENNHDNIQELTGQRNHLLEGKISGQKLAFSLSVSNQQRTKMAAMSKFQDLGTYRLQSKIEIAVKANLDRISDLKTTIALFEKNNDQMALQNDEFRRGAMAGITMVRHVEALTNERNQLSVDLADKALVIRKLLEDNQFLQNKLVSAKFQTNTLIDIAKNEAVKRQQQSRELLETIGQQQPSRESGGSSSPLRSFKA